ncbi:hypothetical protein SAMN04487852_110107 [Prevotella sp. tf2-5]|nr:hypothetical protein SAMN04487852_110107 [Prevotella sp. tf2-5]
MQNKLILISFSADNSPLSPQIITQESGSVSHRQSRLPEQESPVFLLVHVRLLLQLSFALKILCESLPLHGILLNVGLRALVVDELCWVAVVQVVAWIALVLANRGIVQYKVVENAAVEVGHETDDILFDYDHWVCGQDFSDDWSCKVAKVYNVTDSTCLVDLIIHNFSDSETTIALRFERNDWYVDDFSPTDDGEDDKAYFLVSYRNITPRIVNNKR